MSVPEDSLSAKQNGLPTPCRRPPAPNRRPPAPMFRPFALPRGLAFFTVTFASFLSFRHLSPMLSHLGSMLALSWPYVGPSLSLCWLYVGPSWAILAPSWPILAPSWPHLGPILAPCWPILATSWPSWLHRGLVPVAGIRVFWRHFCFIIFFSTS